MVSKLLSIILICLPLILYSFISEGFMQQQPEIRINPLSNSFAKKSLSSPLNSKVSLIQVSLSFFGYDRKTHKEFSTYQKPKYTRRFRE